MTCLYPGPSELYKHIHSTSSGVTAVSACLFFFLQYHPALSDRVCDRPQGAICIGIVTGVCLQSGLSRNTSAKFSPMYSSNQLSCSPLKQKPNALRLCCKAENWKRNTKQVSEPVTSVTSAPADKDRKTLNRRHDELKKKNQAGKRTGYFGHFGSCW